MRHGAEQKSFFCLERRKMEVNIKKIKCAFTLETDKTRELGEEVKLFLDKFIVVKIERKDNQDGTENQNYIVKPEVIEEVE